MLRKKQIILTSHCVLNQNSVIRDWERASGAFNSIVRVLLDYDISIVQLPCPEFTFLGESRPPMTKEEYSTIEYRKHCCHFAEQILLQVKEYLKNGYNIVGILGIEGSPSCDTLGNKGVFMEEVLKLFEVHNIRLDSFDIPEEYIEGKDDYTVKRLISFLETKV